ncbi:hypothetical protein BZA77DRAFT_135017 [Pyronema omphalodes]|nr:hypothetical protein BZA77DRAFT_135017 [Pyronema omphalodes]
MADPLSVSASICGLISLSQQFIAILYSFSTSALDARLSVRRLLSEIESLHTVFHQAQSLIHRPQLSFPSCEHLATILTACVLIYSDLERHLCSFSSLSDVSNVNGAVLVWQSLKWAIKEEELNTLVSDLERQKSNLMLLLGVITCESVTETQQALCKLQSQMSLLLESNQQLSNMMNRRSSCSSVEGITYEAILRTTRLYRRSHLWENSHRFSHTTETKRSRWSWISGLSTNASKVSIFELPVYPTDLWNPEHYEFTRSTRASRTSISRPLSTVITRPLSEKPTPLVFRSCRFLPASDKSEPSVTSFPFSVSAQAWRYLPPDDPIIFGRGSLSNPVHKDEHTPWIEFPTQYISKRHCEIWWRFEAGQTQWFVRDLRSANGTFVNGVKLVPEQETKVKDGDLLWLGVQWKRTSPQEEGFYRCIVKLGLSVVGPRLKNAEKEQLFWRNRLVRLRMMMWRKRDEVLGVPEEMEGSR